MSKLKNIREQRGITQEELAEKSKVSVITIQRIEAGTQPKGYTLGALARALGIKEEALLENQQNSVERINVALLKLINFSSLPFTIFPPANIIVPLIIISIRKEFTPLAKQLVTIQILWAICSFIIFMLSAFIKNWLSISNKFNLIVMVMLVLANVYIIIRNAFEIDKKGKLYFKINFSFI